MPRACKPTGNSTSAQSAACSRPSPNLTLFQQEAADLQIEGGRVVGVVTQGGIEFRARAVVLTVGTFLGGRIHVGLESHPGGRAGDPPSLKLAARLRELNLRVGRLKTGTPPRIDGRSVDYSNLREQHSDAPRPVFSYLGTRDAHPRQLPCHITATNERTHDIIRGATARSPLFSGLIEGVGPRYCPSVEDKVVRFADKHSHQIFIEPEGLDTHEIYPNGISTSLPFDVQCEFVRTIAGFERAHGYILVCPALVRLIDAKKLPHEYVVQHKYKNTSDLVWVIDPSLKSKMVGANYVLFFENGDLSGIVPFIQKNGFLK